VVGISTLIHELEVVGLHRCFLDGIRSAEPVLEVIAGAKILELSLNHRSEIAGRVVSKLYNPAWIALENKDHSAPNLGGRHCHCLIPELGSKSGRIAVRQTTERRPRRTVNVNSLET
jgi:hypothetical protein